MNTIITIDRQFGSGGLEVSRLIAKKKGLPCYDRELIEEATADSGLTKEQIETQDEKPASSVIFGMIADTFSITPLEEEVFLAERDAIRKIARESKDGCVIVGRCADIALRKHTNLIRIFIHADEPFRMKRIREGKTGANDNISYENWTDEQLLALMRRKDRERWEYYDSHSQKRWGQSKNYDFTINTGLLGIEGSVEQILGIIDAFEKTGGTKKYVERD